MGTPGVDEQDLWGLTITEELRLEPTGVVGRELREELAFSSSKLILSDPSLKPLLMELLSSHLQTERKTDRNRERSLN